MPAKYGSDGRVVEGTQWSVPREQVLEDQLAAKDAEIKRILALAAKRGSDDQLEIGRLRGELDRITRRCRCTCSPELLEEDSCGSDPECATAQAHAALAWEPKA